MADKKMLVDEFDEGEILAATHKLWEYLREQGHSDPRKAMLILGATLAGLGNTFRAPYEQWGDPQVRTLAASLAASFIETGEVGFALSVLGSTAQVIAQVVTTSTHEEAIREAERQPEEPRDYVADRGEGWWNRR
jgi:hypothetical protein